MPVPVHTFVHLSFSRPSLIRDQARNGTSGIIPHAIQVDKTEFSPALLDIRASIFSAHFLIEILEVAREEKSRELPGVDEACRRALDIHPISTFTMELKTQSLPLPKLIHVS